MALGQATDQPELRYQLTMNFAHQLEVEGLWEWAIYVILNLPFSPKSPKFHRDLVVDVLSRHLHKQEDKKDDNKHKTNFLIMVWVREGTSRHSSGPTLAFELDKFLQSSLLPLYEELFRGGEVSSSKQRMGDGSQCTRPISRVPHVAH